MPPTERNHPRPACKFPALITLVALIGLLSGPVAEASICIGDEAVVRQDALLEREQNLRTSILPNGSEIEAVYPNPFNSTATVRFSIPERSNVRVAIRDVQGRRIKTVIDSNLEGGRYRYSFSSDDMPAGLYFLSVEALGRTEIQKIGVLK